MMINKGKTTAIAGGALGFAVLLGIGVAGADRSPTSDPSVVVADQVGDDSAIDVLSVHDTTGAYVGQRSSAELAAAKRTGRDIVLPMGTGKVPVKGFRVYDEAGRLVGYEANGLGFFTLAEAADAPRMDRLIAENEASEQEAYERFRPEFVERFGE